MPGDWFVRLLIVEYLLAACAYFWQFSIWKGVYFVGAAIISVAVLRLR